MIMNKSKNTKKLEKEIDELHCEVQRLKRVHCEYLRLHSDFPEKIADVLRRIKSLYRQSRN